MGRRCQFSPPEDFCRGLRFEFLRKVFEFADKAQFEVRLLTQAAQLECISGREKIDYSYGLGLPCLLLNLKRKV